MTKSLVSYNTIILPSPDKLRFSPPNPAPPVARQIRVCRDKRGVFQCFIETVLIILSPLRLFPFLFRHSGGWLHDRA